MKKAIIIGIDGGTFNLIDKFIEKGELPFFSYIKKNGAFSIMESVEQDTRVPISPTIWTSLATGKKDEKHKIKSFFNLQQDIESARFFEIFNYYKMNVGNWGWELTWPPEDYGAFNIPCVMARDDKTIPGNISIVQELRRKTKKGKTSIFENISYFFKLKSIGVNNSTLLSLIKFYLNTPKDKKESDFKRMLIGNRINEDVFISLCKKYNPDISFFFIPTADTAAHYFWKYFDKENFPEINNEEREKYGNYLLEVYREVDRKIQRIYELNKDAYLFLLSDHGMGPIRQGSFETISLKNNKFLELTELKEKVDFFHIGLNIVIVPKENSNIDSKGLYNYLKNIKLLPVNLPLFETIEMDNTGRIYIKVQQKDKDFYKEYNIEDLYVRIGIEKFPFKDIININELERSADHEKDGIFLCLGKDIYKGKQLPKSKIYDFLPTLLAVMNIPIAKDFDGDVMPVKDFSEIKYIDTYDFLIKKRKKIEKTDDEFVKEELRRLGYLKDK